MLTRINNSKGFSLIEIIIYISLFAIISIVVINCYLVTFSSFSKTRSNKDLLESGNLSMERISREIRNASSIDVANSSLGSSPGVLQLNSVDELGNSQTVKFNVSGGELVISYNGVSIGNLLGNNISVSSLIFRRIGTTASGEAVKIELILQDNKSQDLKIENFYNTIVLRGSY